MSHTVLSKRRVATTKMREQLLFQVLPKSKSTTPEIVPEKAKGNPFLENSCRLFIVWNGQLKIQSRFSDSLSIYIEPTWISQSPTTVLSSLLTLDQIQLHWLWKIWYRNDSSSQGNFLTAWSLLLSTNRQDFLINHLARIRITRNQLGTMLMRDEVLSTVDAQHMDTSGCQVPDLVSLGGFRLEHGRSPPTRFRFSFFSLTLYWFWNGFNGWKFDSDWRRARQGEF